MSEPRTQAEADALLEAWVTPVNWEDGSAEVEGRLIEGKARLVDATRAYLSRPAPSLDAPTGSESEARLREALERIVKLCESGMRRRGVGAGSVLIRKYDADEALYWARVALVKGGE